MKTGAVIGFVAGFFIGPIYFNYAYPFLYHLVRRPVVTFGNLTMNGQCSEDGKLWWPARDGVRCYSLDKPR